MEFTNFTPHTTNRSAARGVSKFIENQPHYPGNPHGRLVLRHVLFSGADSSSELRHTLLELVLDSSAQGSECKSNRSLRKHAFDGLVEDIAKGQDVVNSKAEEASNMVSELIGDEEEVS